GSSGDWAECFDQEATAVQSSDEYEVVHGSSNPMVKIDKVSDELGNGGSGAELHLPISIPRSRPKPTRHVSFNLRENSVLQLPSNSAIGKIASARAKRRLSLSAELDRHLADTRAKALLPHGASPDLLDPGFAMTSLYVKRGHIHSLEKQHTLALSPASSDTAIDDIGLKIGSSATCMPVKGVLKPFTPSPVHASFYMNELGSIDGQKTLNEEEEEEERMYEEILRRRREKAKKEEAEMEHEHENEHKHKHKQKHSKKSKKGSKKKKC
ncbi:hypothetical protein FB639_005961, partial [Coemansia asiatica]